MACTGKVIAAIRSAARVKRRISVSFGFTRRDSCAQETANADAWQRLPKNLQDIVSRNFETARTRCNDDSAKALGSAEFQDEAKKKTLEADLLPGEELQALAKEVIVQPPEIIGQIRKLMGE